MPKCLYITESYIARFSGSRMMNRGFDKVLSCIFSHDNYDVVALTSAETSEKFPDNFQIIQVRRNMYSLVKGYSVEVDSKAVDKIIKKIQSKQYDFVFLSHNTLGTLAKTIKKRFPNIVLCTYYPGIMIYHHWYSYQYIGGKGLKSYIKKFYKIHNEKLSNIYTDAVLLLNKRDENNLKKYYDISDDSKFFFCPIFMEDRYDEERQASISETENPYDEGEFNILFVGAYFGPNVHGIRWFYKEVLSCLEKSVRLTIIGSGMQSIENEINNESVEIHDFVENLDPYYANADIVIEPIFQGDGMKTKTAEALMYGKTIVGTAEAFCGYADNAGYVCNTAGEFVAAIRKLRAENVPKCRKEYRDIYVKNHSYKAGERNLRKVLRHFRIDP